MSKTYIRPTLRVQGKLEAVTQGQSKGSNLDAAFPAGTAFGDLTFS